MTCTTCAEARESQALSVAMKTNATVILLDDAILTATQHLTTLRKQRKELAVLLLRQPLPA